MDPPAIFRQLGFVEGEGCLTRTLRLELFDETSITEVRAAGGGMPTSATRRFDVAMINPDVAVSGDLPTRLELRDASLDDAVALAVSEVNDKVVREGDQPPEPLLFSDGEIAYSNAFAEDERGDWNGTLDAERGCWVLVDPAWRGKIYADWRASIMDLARAGALGPLLARPSREPAAPAPR